MRNAYWNSLWNRLRPTGWIAPRRRSGMFCSNREWECGVENLEPRIVPAALSDLAPVSIETPVVASPDTKIPVQLRIENLGEVVSPRVRIEIRVSADDVIDGQDRLLATVTQGKIQAGGQAQWTQTITMPDDLPIGSYHLGVVIDPDNRIPELDESNNRLASEDTVSILRETLTGRVKAQGGAKTVELRPLAPAGGHIDPNLTTWIVIHGRNESATGPDVVAMAQQIDGFQQSDQVLVLDWSRAAASRGLGGRGENYIKPVAKWAADALRDYGFSGEQLNLVGYSWGAEVAAEIAEEIGTVNSLLAIDPARDYPGGTYNPEAPGEVNLRAHAEHSWAFYSASGLELGSPLVANTAEHDAVVIGSSHFGIMKVVISLMALPPENPVAEDIPLIASLLNNAPLPAWQDDSYSATSDTDFEDGLFDILVMASVNGEAVVAFSFFLDDEEITVEV